MTYFPISIEINEHIKKIKSVISWNWVKSHQNDTSLPDVLNNNVDALAQACRTSNKSTPQWAPLSNNMRIILHNDIPIMNNNNILSASDSDHLLYYFSEKWKIPQKNLYLIDWISFKSEVKIKFKWNFTDRKNKC